MTSDANGLLIESDVQQKHQEGKKKTKENEFRYCQPGHSFFIWMLHILAKNKAHPKTNSLN
jgi:hypothetical protein